MKDDGKGGTHEEQRKMAIPFLKSHIVSHKQCFDYRETPEGAKVKLRVGKKHAVDVDILPTFIYYGTYI